MKKIAVVGSRDYDNLEGVRTFVTGFAGADVEIVSGGARGVDREAEKTSRRLGIPVKVFPADWERHGKQAGFIRNQQIVDYCDELVAFWDGTSNGTRHAYRQAVAQEKPVAVFNSQTGRWMLFRETLKGYGRAL